MSRKGLIGASLLNGPAIVIEPPTPTPTPASTSTSTRKHDGKRSNATWPPANVKRLLALRIENKKLFQKTRGQRLVLEPPYTAIAKLLNQELSTDYTWKQCHDKVENCIRDAKKIRDHNKSTGLGVDDKQVYEYDAEIVEIMGEKTWEPVITASAGAGKVEVQVHAQTQHTSSSSSSAPNTSSSDTDTDTAANKSKKMSVKELKERKARASDGSRRHNELLVILKDGFEKIDADAKTEGERLEHVVNNMVDKITGGNEMKDELKKMKQQQQQLQDDMNDVKAMLLELVKQKKRGRTEDDGD